MTRKSKAQIVADLLAAGFKTTSNRREGTVDQTKTGPLAMRRLSVLVPGSKWSLEVGDWCKKGLMRKNEKRVLDELKAACGKDAHFDLCDHDMGHSDDGDVPNDAYVDFYVFTTD